MAGSQQATPRLLTAPEAECVVMPATTYAGTE